MATVTPRPARRPDRTPGVADAGPRTPVRRRREEESLGELLSEAAADAQRLFRQEVELAKAEMREEAAKAGKAAGMYGGAGFAGYMLALFLSLAAAFGLANVMDAGWGALIVAGVWGLIGAVLYLVGRSTMRKVSPKPEQTIETLKEDAQWARHRSG